MEEKIEERTYTDVGYEESSKKGKAKKTG